MVAPGARMTSEAPRDKSSRHIGCLLAVIVFLVVLLVLVLLFSRSIWWKEEGAVVPRGTAVEPPRLPPALPGAPPDWRVSRDAA